MSEKEQKQTEYIAGNLSSKIIDKINDEHISPTPKWHFILKDDVYWLLWLLSVCVGAVSVTGMIFGIDNSGWKYYTVTHGSFFAFVLDALPFMWFLTLLIIALVSYINMRHTKNGYKYPLWGVLISSVGVSVIAGVVLYGAGLGDYFDREIGEHLPFHISAVAMQKKVWMNPEKGFLAGRVLSFTEDDNNLLLEDLSGMNWEIDTTEMNERDFFVLSNEENVRIVGIPSTGSSTEAFYACFVFPWKLPGDEMIKGKAIFFGKKLPPSFEMRFGPGTSERIDDSVRSNRCRDVRPYNSLQRIRDSI